MQLSTTKGIEMTPEPVWSNIEFRWMSPEEYALVHAAPVAAAEEATITYAEARGVERMWDRIESRRATNSSAPCRRCGTYCYGDCSAAR